MIGVQGAQLIIQPFHLIHIARQFQQYRQGFTQRGLIAIGKRLQPFTNDQCS